MTKKNNVKKIYRADQSVGPVGPTGKFWTQWIKPKGAAFISENLMPVHFVIKNHGPGDVLLVAQRGKTVDLPPGVVHVTYAAGLIRVENREENPVFIEFEFLPIFRK
jgi:hypothetical protein